MNTHIPPRVLAMGAAMLVLIGVVMALSDRGRSMLAGAANLVGVSLTPANTSVSSGPAYLVSNQPWYYGSPASAVVPSAATQATGANATPVPAFSNTGCGCY